MNTKYLESIVRDMDANPNSSHLYDFNCPFAPESRVTLMASHNGNRSRDLRLNCSQFCLVSSDALVLAGCKVLGILSDGHDAK